MKDVWVVAEERRGELAQVTLEMLDEGRRIADRLGGALCAALMGEGVAGLTETLGHYGADKVYLLEHPLLAPYTTDAHTAALADLVQRYTPGTLILPATPNGKDLAPRLAMRLGVGLAADCIRLRVNDLGVLEMTRPTHGGKVYTTVACTHSDPQMATIRPGVIGVGGPDESRRAEIVRVNVKIDPQAIRTRVVGFVKANPKTIDLNEAEIIVAGGRGVGGTAKWHLIEELADALDGSVGGSRVAMDLGCVPWERMVGQTGKTVAPQLYVAVGISGARQHVSGMKDAKLVIAINSDRAAPILKVADMGIVGDLHQVVPALTRRLVQAADSARSDNSSGADKDEA